MTRTKQVIAPFLPQGIGPRGIDEMNLAEFPIFALGESESRKDGLIFQGPHGKGTLKILVHPKFGLPTACDEDVLIGLVQIAKAHSNFQNLETPFRPSELLRMLGWSECGKNFGRLRLALDRLKHIEFYFTNSWWNTRLRDYTSASFDMIDDYEIDSRSRVGPDGQPQSYVRWNKKFMEIFRPEYFKRLDLPAYFSLETPIAKRLYRLVDKRFYHGNEIFFDLKELAFDRIGLSRSYRDAGKIKEKLHPHIEILMERGFLVRLTKADTYQRIARGEWKAKLVRGPGILPYEHEIQRRALPVSKAKTDPKPTILAPPQPVSEPQPQTQTKPSLPPSLDAPSPLVRLLTDRGVTRKQAERLEENHSEVVIQEKIAVFDWIQAHHKDSMKTNPAGWLITSIEENYDPPQEYLQAQNRQQKRAECDDEVVKQQLKRRQEQAQIRAERVENERLDKVINSMSDQERQNLEQAALATLSAEDRLAYEVLPRTSYQKHLRDLMRDELKRRAKHSSW